MKVGIIRCQLFEDMCPGSTDFKVASEGTMAFEESGPVEVIGILSCGGCSGKKAITRAKMIVDRGAEAIVFASCMKNGTPIGYSVFDMSQNKGEYEDEKNINAYVRMDLCFHYANSFLSHGSRKNEVQHG